jgi:hypothetical protein
MFFSPSKQIQPKFIFTKEEVSEINIDVKKPTKYLVMHIYEWSEVSGHNFDFNKRKIGFLIVNCSKMNSKMIREIRWIQKVDHLIIRGIYNPFKEIALTTPGTSDHKARVNFLASYLGDKPTIRYYSLIIYILLTSIF